MKEDLLEIVRSRNTALLMKVLTAHHEQAQLDEALQESVVIGWVEAIAPIVSAGGNLHSVDPVNAWPLLHLATEMKQRDSIKELIRLGADINSRDPAGWTPLHLAVDLAGDAAEQKGADPDIGTIQLLRSLGADTRCVDTNNKTAYDLAKEWNQAKLLEALS